ncbi:hypothetical protein ABH920_006683 [Catenulispora sp. EB89]|uniref:hypothetical protein n=1 Tax=Catenulispora sp. EB89 TaxID=3156257 RepID=UPI003514FFE7
MARRRVPARELDPTIDEYCQILARIARQADSTLGLSTLQMMARRGARSGSIAPADALRLIRPAAVTVDLVAEKDQSATSIAVATTIVAAAGDNVAEWARLIIRIVTWRGSLRELLDDKPATDGGVAPPVGLRAHGESLWAPNILLALAPPHVARAILADVTPLPVPLVPGLAMTDVMVRHAPLCRELVDHVVGPAGTANQRRVLARNPLASDALLERLLDLAPDGPEVAAAIRVHPEVGGRVRRAAFLAGRHDGTALEASFKAMKPCGRQFLEMIEAAPHEIEWILSSLRHCNRYLEAPARRIVYGLLAETAGPEVVWALDLERAGSLEKMDARVRASMKVGSGEPLRDTVRDRRRMESAAVATADRFGLD